MAMKDDTKTEEELTCCFKIDMNFTKLDPALEKSKNIFFNWLLATKIYTA